MSWADRAIAELRSGRVTTLHSKGNSMEPKIKSGAEVVVAPIVNPDFLKPGDIVLVTMGSNDYVHLILATDANRVQISNNKGHINGWASKKSVHGMVISIVNK